MSITYNTIAGDTFDKVARKKYGTADGPLIRSANPAISEPIPPGTTLAIPDQPTAPRDQPGGTPSDNPDEVAIIVAGEVFRFWEEVSITRTVDQMDVFSLSAPSSRKLKPLSFDTVSVTVGGAPLFTGTLINVQPTVSAGREMDEASGYSLPGVLNDCTMPASAYPLEFNDQSLEEIAATLLRPFGLSVVFEATAGSVFDRVAMGGGDKILTFLAKLSAQRNLVIGSSSTGDLVFSAPTVGDPVALLEQGASPLTRVVALFAPQDYFSDITGIEPVIVGLQGQKHTVKNDRLGKVVRPHTFLVDDATEGDLKAAVRSKAARMFGSAIEYFVDVSTWRNAAGGLWEPGTTVQLTSEAGKVFGPFNFLIRAVTFQSSPTGRTATLTLVLPSVFSGQIPERMPWDE